MSRKSQRVLPTVQVREVFHKEPIRKEHIDRNAPCPCGSGKKYKRCCAEGENLSFFQKVKKALWPFD